MLKRMILSGLIAAMAAPALASDVSYDVKVLSPQEAASATVAHAARRAPRKAANARKNTCTCEEPQHHV